MVLGDLYEKWWDRMKERMGQRLTFSLSPAPLCKHYSLFLKPKVLFIQLTFMQTKLHGVGRSWRALSSMFMVTCSLSHTCIGFVWRITQHSRCQEESFPWYSNCHFRQMQKYIWVCVELLDCVNEGVRLIGRFSLLIHHAIGSMWR